MADTFTTFLNLTLPEIGASDDTWGDKLNDNFDILDALFGTSGEGTVIVRDANNDALVSSINVTRGHALTKQVKFKTGTVMRWDIGADASSESGSNVGSGLLINRYSDLGALLGTPLQISRANGAIMFETTPTVGSNDVWHAGNDTTLRTPVGLCAPYLGVSLPSSKWLFPCGQTFSNAAYPELATLLGTRFNTGGEGVGNTRLPDLRGLVVMCRDGITGFTNRGLLSTIDATQWGGLNGAETQALSQTHLPGITLTVNIPANQGLHSHVIDTSGAAYLRSGTGNSPAGGSNGSGGPHTPTILDAVLPAMTGSVALGGSSTPISVLQPCSLMNYIVRALP